MKRFGLIGFPLGHSFSKKFFTEKFEKEDIKAEYNNYELENILSLENLKKDEKLYGLNVTIPYKEKVIPLLDDLDETAAAIGAVNVIRFIRNEGKLKLKGYNSDVVGFENSIYPLLKPEHKKALILGTGGASKAIEYVLKKAGLEIKFVSRKEKDENLLYADINKDILSEYSVIVNATPLGTFPKTDECPAIPYEFLDSHHLLYDVVYNPAETLFLKKGKAQGADVLNGEQMLVAQAIESWRIWNL